MLLTWLDNNGQTKQPPSTILYHIGLLSLLVSTLPNTLRAAAMVRAFEC